MTDAPEKIFVTWPDKKSAGRAFLCQARPPARRAEYVRADIHAAAEAKLERYTALIELLFQDDLNGVAEMICDYEDIAELAASAAREQPND